jgi:3-deoxy-D-manno-octulosonic-acid transferase
MLLFLYNLFLPIALLVSLPHYLRRMLKRGGYARNFGQRFGLYSRSLRARLATGDWIWIRAVSVGEMMQALDLSAELHARRPELCFVISTTTSTGNKLGLEKADRRVTEVVYSPLDFFPIVSRLLNRIKPLATVMIDSDLWPSFLAAASLLKVPAYVANARLSPRSEKRYSRLHWLARKFFWDRISTLCAQDLPDAGRWRKLGLSDRQIRVTGSLKYDTARSFSLENSPDFRKWLVVRGFDLDRPILLGGSLHPGEEELLCDCCQNLLAQFRKLFLVLAPRHAERTPEIEELLRRRGLIYALRSEGNLLPQTSVLVLNSTGELRHWYRTAQVVVMGKSFRGKGGQNPVEPILAGKPVICGPHMENFAHLMTELREAKAVEQLSSEAALAPTVQRLLSSPEHARSLVRNASQVLDQHRGAIQRTAQIILEGIVGSEKMVRHLPASSRADGLD